MIKRIPRNPQKYTFRKIEFRCSALRLEGEYKRKQILSRSVYGFKEEKQLIRLKYGGAQNSQGDV